jgi:hypothetical protein
MRRSLVLSSAVLVLLAIQSSTSAWAQSSNGKNCRMEQQCHWVNFKKVCTYVKVCR